MERVIFLESESEPGMVGAGRQYSQMKITPEQRAEMEVSFAGIPRYGTAHGGAWK